MGVNPPSHTPSPPPGSTVGVWDKIPPAPVCFSPVCSSKSCSGRAQPPAPFRKGRDIYNCLAQGVGICRGCLHPPQSCCSILQLCPAALGPIQPCPALGGSLCDSHCPWYIFNPWGRSPCNARCPLGALCVTPAVCSGFYCLLQSCFSINLGRSGLEASPSLSHPQPRSCSCPRRATPARCVPME